MTLLRWPQSRTCDHCGASFLVYRTHPYARFCSLSHAMQGQRRLPWLACPTCEIRFPQRRARQRYCSVECGRYGPRKAAA